MDDKTNTSNQKTSPEANSNRQVLIAVVIALVIIGALWVWKSIEIGNLRKQTATEQAALKKDATAQFIQAHSDHLKLLAKPFVWALRTEMLQNNMNQVNLYMSDMVKEKNIQRIIITNVKGVVVASTNKKDEGQLLSAIVNDAEPNVDQTKVAAAGNVLTMTSPVMGFNNRLGTLLIRYAVPQPEFK